jgi:hypothetical protein
MCVATIGTAADAQRVDNMRTGYTSEDDEAGAGAGAGGGPQGGGGGGALQRFYLHYFFPPSSVGETGRVGPAGGCPCQRGWRCCCFWMRVAPAMVRSLSLP